MVGVLMTETQPSGAPAAIAAFWIISTVSIIDFNALGCGEKTMLLAAFNEINAL